LGRHSGGKISEANLDGTGNGSTVNTGSATVNSPNGVSIDSAANRIYWVNFGANSISEASLDGTGGSNVTVSDPTLIDGPGAIAVDPPANKIFWVNEKGGQDGTGSISEANLDGTEPQDLSTGGATVNDPQEIAIDPADNKIFWTNTGNNTISFADLDNTGIGANLTITGTASPVSNPVGLAVDPVARRICLLGRCCEPGAHFVRGPRRCRQPRPLNDRCERAICPRWGCDRPGGQQDLLGRQGWPKDL
jgi:DNA-binding beta-propeller fold protein YncE